MTARAIGQRASQAGCALLLMAGFVESGLTARGASAHEDSSTKKHRSQPARTAQTAPDRTGSIAKAILPRPPSETTVPVSASPVPDRSDEGPFVPVLLPTVPRGRMIACGEAWRSMKMQGTTGDDSWRDFALTCLVAKDAPTP